jgi:hypothetical protein
LATSERLYICVSSYCNAYTHVYIYFFDNKGPTNGATDGVKGQITNESPGSTSVTKIMQTNAMTLAVIRVSEETTADKNITTESLQNTEITIHVDPSTKGE